MYKKIILPVLFLFDPEKVHNFTFLLFKIFLNIPFVGFLVQKIYSVDNKKLSKKLFGIEFKNPVGLAAGFDKNAEVYNSLFKLGFGFVEVGTITPLKQYGNPKPRGFRLVDDEALIN